MELLADNLSLTINKKPILSDVSFTVHEGDFVSLLGASGAGKSTILQVLAGLIPQSAGSIYCDNTCLDTIPAHKRDIAMVFQDFRLFPNMNVIENVAFPCKMKCIHKKERLRIAKECLNAVQLSDYASCHIQKLSGGQAQRVALARALAARPRLLLLDEPFSGLDEQLRDDMRSLVLKLHKHTKTTTIMVTHDAHEALMMSDNIIYISHGKVLQQCSPEELYARPTSPLVATCFGECSTLTGTVTNNSFICNDFILPLSLSANQPTIADGKQAQAIIRHASIAIASDIYPSSSTISPVHTHTQAPVANQLASYTICQHPLRVRCGVFHGDSYYNRLDLNGQTLTVKSPTLHNPSELIHVAVSPSGIFIFEQRGHHEC